MNKLIFISSVILLLISILFLDVTLSIKEEKAIPIVSVTENDIEGNNKIKTPITDNNILEPILTGKHGLNDTLYWGTYKPHTYFSMKTRSTMPINTGMIWSTPNVNKKFSRFLYKVSQGDDGVSHYEWTKHDGKNFGIQDIVDKAGNLNITTSFIKNPGPKGGDWSVRISGRSNSVFESPIVSLMYYIQDESIQKGSKQSLNIKGFDNSSSTMKKGLEGDLQIKGTHPEIGDYTLYFSDVPNSMTPKGPFLKSQPSVSKWHYYGIQRHDQDNWDMLSSIFDKATNSALQPMYTEWMKPRDVGSTTPTPPFIPTLPNIMNDQSNTIVIQRVLQVPFDIEISFISNDYHYLKDGQLLTEDKIEKVVKDITGTNFNNILERYEQSFNETFFEKFFSTNSQQPVNIQISRKIQYRESYKLSMSSLSSLLGGIGYWYGKGTIKTSKGITKTQPHAVPLYSATPSRPAFPRGFLWDEGFHQLVISSFDVSITVECLSYWLNLMDESGWIPREQILGREAMSMVPKEFQVQSFEIANPPALMLAVNKLVDIVDSFKQQHLYGTTPKDIEIIQEFLRDAYPRLVRFYGFYWKTQSSVVDGLFRWRGRVENHTLSSGLDDYPRPYPNTSEIHVDLSSWIAFFAESLSKISIQLGKDDEKRFIQDRQRIVKAIESLLWDEESKLYQDIIYQNGQKVVFKTHGYVNYFPFLLGLIDEDSPHLKDLLENLKDTKGIWSRFGILSLSRKDPFFGTGENYWKGPIWFNINYLFTHTMYKKYIKAGPLKENIHDLYTTLRQNLLSNVLKNYRSTGYLWEQYDPEDGTGKRNHPFNGWTSLVVLVISEHF